MDEAPLVEVSSSELVRLSAADPFFFDRTFFGGAFRQEPAEGHRRMVAAIENPAYRLVNMRCARDWAKTTRARLAIARRVAFGLMRTGFYLGASEDHAARTVRWLKNRIEPKLDGRGNWKKPLYAEIYGLEPGDKWTDTEIEIKHRALDHPIWLKGAGMTGSIRGINFDDYRPDFIVCDDPLTDENTATREQREKTIDLLLGAVHNSLAPVSEEPNAKMLLLQTPLHPEDAEAEATNDPTWHSVIVPCWTPETMDAPLEEQESSWPARYSSETLRADKKSYIARNRLSIWTREKECRLISAETAAFKPEWLNYYEDEPPRMTCVLSIDPVPPPSEIQLAKNLVGKDYEAHTVVGRFRDEYYLLDYRVNRGHEPNWSAVTALDLALRWRVMRINVETVAYQRVLVGILKQAMIRSGRHWLIKEFKSKQSKYNRITSTFAGIASHGKWRVHPRMIEFIAQWSEYPRTAHDDLLDSASIGVADLANPYLELDDDEFSVLDTTVPELPNIYRSP